MNACGAPRATGTHRFVLERLLAYPETPSDIMIMMMMMIRM